MTAPAIRIPELMYRIVELAEAMGVTNLKALPDLWRVDLPDGWTLKVNAQKTEIEGVPPFHAMMAGPYVMDLLIVSPTGGTAGAGSEQRACRVLKKAIDAAHARKEIDRCPSP